MLVVKRSPMASAWKVTVPLSSTRICSDSVAIMSESTTPVSACIGRSNMRAAAALAWMMRPPPSTANTLAKTVSMMA